MPACLLCLCVDAALDGEQVGYMYIWNDTPYATHTMQHLVALNNSTVTVLSLMIAAPHTLHERPHLPVACSCLPAPASTASGSSNASCLGWQAYRAGECDPHCWQKQQLSEHWAAAGSAYPFGHRPYACCCCIRSGKAGCAEGSHLVIPHPIPRYAHRC